VIIAHTSGPVLIDEVFARFALGIKNGPTSGIGLFGFCGDSFQCIIKDVCMSVFVAAVTHQEMEIRALNLGSNFIPWNDGLKFNMKVSMIYRWMLLCNISAREKSSSD
jgi:hypothetical protein